MQLLSTAVAALCCLPGGAVIAQAPTDQGQGPAAAAGPANPYNLQPFHPDFPVTLQYPPRSGREYDRTRRQVAEQLVANLEGSGRREAWQAATEFFWNGPEEVIEPLIRAMDRAFGDPSRTDMVRNCVEAMGRMGNPAFDEALRRALEHKDDRIRQAALGALASSGKPETVRNLFAVFEQMNARSRTAWLRAVRERLGSEAATIYAEILGRSYPASVRDEVVGEALRLAPAEAAKALGGRWGEAAGEFRAVLAGVLHAAGDARGTAWIREQLRGEDLALLPLAIKHTRGEPGVLRNDLLSLSTHPRAEVRLELARLLQRYEGDDIADVYEILSQPDEVWEVKSLALRELNRRGRSAMATALLEEVQSAEGTRLRRTLDMLGATADPRAVPIFQRRFQQAPAGEGRPFLQSLAVLGGEAAARAMLELFEGEEKLVDRSGPGGALTTVNYLPLLLMNVRGTEAQIVAAFERLDKSDWRRRAALMPTILGMAADRNDPVVTAQCVAPIKAVLFDREQQPQLRVLALNLLTRRNLTIDDVMRLKRMRFDESDGMRVLLTDFLNLYF
ncbi:MAG: HEAT repeat domain-containing protein [Planctomycetes bacterium]|nr:HEAT repeat domain-containing protein [Planctomycetota bacterium]